MNVKCSVCEKNAQYNTTLGVYYCPEHGYETRLENTNEYMSELVENLEQMKILI
ncbi:MAG: hypothetical protein JSV56_03545 [Methanomassiliicoccales archaeon]|nr:MAG: hypothetical protein JSV56_03545 [Methanomassiliicoccales archaeon]